MANLTWHQVVRGINCLIQFVWLLGALVQHKYLFPVSVFHLCAGWCQSSVCSQPGRPHRGSGPTSPGRS